MLQENPYKVENIVYKVRPPWHTEGGHTHGCEGLDDLSSETEALKWSNQWGKGTKIFKITTIVELVKVEI